MEHPVCHRFPGSTRAVCTRHTRAREVASHAHMGTQCVTIFTGPPEKTRETVYGVRVHRVKVCGKSIAIRARRPASLERLLLPTVCIVLRRSNVLEACVYLLAYSTCFWRKKRRDEDKINSNRIDSSLFIVDKSFEEISVRKRCFTISVRQWIANTCARFNFRRYR